MNPDAASVFADPVLWAAQLVRSVLASYDDLKMDLWRATIETLYMTFATTGFAVIAGFGLAILMILTGPHGLKPNARIYRVLDLVVNLVRSIPFIILILLLMGITSFVMGTTIGTRAAIFPLTVAAAPFAARIIEGSFLEVDRGVVEAARSFGASRWQVIVKVMLPEALPSIVLNIAVLAIAVVGYSAMAGVVGGGGLGDLAYRIGFLRFQRDAIVWSVLILLLLVQVIQSVGNFCYKKLR
jgi:ABC-type metal ion transport system, permease component